MPPARASDAPGVVDESEKSTLGRRITPAFAGQCGSRILPGRDERVSSSTGVCRASVETLARRDERASSQPSGILRLGDGAIVRSAR